MKYYYDDGKGIRIILGDCRELLPQLDKVDLCLVDPPYGAAMTGGTWGKKMDSTYKKWDAIPFDDTDILRSAAATCIIWGGNYFSLPPSRGWLIWRKPYMPTMADAEMAWTNIDMNTRVFESIRADGGKQFHPTAKPLKLMTWCLTFTPDARTVIDPLMGGGTTLRACKDLGLSCTGIDINESYCEAAARRLEQECLTLSPVQTETNIELFAT